jgi:hypothetical protein
MIEEGIMEEGEKEVGQAIEGYGCSCGFKTEDLREFRRHMLGKQHDSENVHKSLGRVDMLTGEVIMPPWNERTPEQKSEAKHGRRKKEKGGDGSSTAIKTTDVLAEAQQIKFVPRVYTADYTPIMRMAQDAAVHYWGWRPNMPLENFIDTCLYLFFKEKGITLGGYIVDEELLEEEKEVEGAS